MPTSQQRIPFKRILQLAMVAYIIAVHILLVFLVANIATINFNPKLASASSQHVQNMLVYHRWMDGSVPDKAVIFLGDSIIQGLATAAVAPYSVNYGIGGENTAQLLDAMPSYKSLNRAHAIVLAIGHNDFSQGVKKGIIERYQKIVKALPNNVTLIWSSVMPTRPGLISFLDATSTNSAIKTMCEKRGNCIFVDTWSFLADANGQIIKQYFLDDGAHLSQSGYKQWITALRQAVQQVPAVPIGKAL
jgi:lysophospholipase L1-like esterase